MADDDSTDDGRIDRRKFLGGLGTGLAAGMAGCGGDGDGGATPTEAPTATPTEGTGGTPTETATSTGTGTGGPGTSSLMNNPMGYTGADDLIQQDQELMDYSQRFPVVRQICAKIWNDAPTNITEFSNLLEPTRNQWQGWVGGLGGIHGEFSYLNIRQEGGGSGGTPTIGMAVPPATLNPYATGTVYSTYVVNRVMGPGNVVTHPDDQSFQPWIIRDWEIMPENVGSSSPTITGELRDDMTFTDGESLTAEDYQFSVNYYKNNTPGGTLTNTVHQKVEEVRVDSPDGTTFSVFMSEKDQRWFTNVLGYNILPQHIWSNIDNPVEYSPRESEEGLVGLGAWELVDFSWENWFELETRDDYPLPSAEYATWLDDGGPFIDGLRFEIYGSQNAMEQAVLNGDLDAGFVASGFTVTNAVRAQNNENLTVHQNSDSGYNHISYNLRRVPLDDVAFRQFLVAMTDKTWIVENPYQGIGATEGTYVVPEALPQWRPDPPSEIDEVEGIPVPDLAFPGEPGTFNVSGESLQAARDFLVNHSEAKHDYSFGEAYSNVSNAPDSQELYVNGEPLTEAHTDNLGNPGQGPLIFSFQPPQEDLYQARTGQQFVGLLKKVGIPIEPRVKTINAQIPTVYGQEDFDIYSMGWALPVTMTHFAQLYGSEGADVYGLDDD